MNHSRSSRQSSETANGVRHSLMKYGMWACCAVMLLPVVAYIAAGGSFAGFGGSLVTFAPLALCLGMHLVMHKFMGKSCHSSAKDETPGVPQATTVPDVRALSAMARE